MSVRNRIKILRCHDFEEAEQKVNDFLANNEEIEQLVAIDYKLEYCVVIIEYYYNVVGDGDDDSKNNNRLMETDNYYYSYSLNNNPFTCWWNIFTSPLGRFS